MSDQTEVLLVVFTFIGVIISAIIGWKTIEFSRKQHERSALIDIFKMLNNSNHKKAEGNIFDAHESGVLMHGDQISPAYEDDAKTVWRNYDQAGSLVTKELVPPEAYYQQFGKVTVIAYFILLDEINRRRITSPEFMTFFKKLVLECFDNKGYAVITDPKYPHLEITRNQLTRE